MMPLMTMLNQTRYTHGSKQIGEVWKPNGSRIPLGEGKEDEQKKQQTFTVGDTVNIRSSAEVSYANGRSAARNGFRVSGSQASNSASGITLDDSGARTEVLKRTEAATVSLSVDGDGLRSLNIAYADGRESVTMAIEEDMRISWDENGEPVITKGAAALNGNKLQATGQNEILIRMSGADVVAGDSTTVLNFSALAGNFSGGSDVTYLGSYTESTFTYDKGASVDFAGLFTNSIFDVTGGNASFSGVFEGSTINADGPDTSYSGIFHSTLINAGNSDNLFTGLFLENTSITAGEGKDKFTGRFIDSDIDAGDGDNVFGGNFTLSTFGQNTNDFTNTTIKAGTGNDTFFSAATESNIDLGDGDNTVKGVFMDSSVKTGAGRDTISAMYGNSSVFNAGAGDDQLAVGTGFTNQIIAGAGKNNVTLGYNTKGYGDESYRLYGVDSSLTDSRWQTLDERESKIDPKAFGEIRGNSISASEGENSITINSGQATHTIRTGVNKTEEEAIEDSPENALVETRAQMQNMLEEMVPVDGLDGDKDEKEDRYMVAQGADLRSTGVIGATIDGGTDNALDVLVDDRVAGAERAAEKVLRSDELSDEQIFSGNAAMFGVFGDALDHVKEAAAEANTAENAKETDAEKNGQNAADSADGTEKNSDKTNAEQGLTVDASAAAQAGAASQPSVASGAAPAASGTAANPAGRAAASTAAAASGKSAGAAGEKVDETVGSEKTEQESEKTDEASRLLSGASNTSISSGNMKTAADSMGAVYGTSIEKQVIQDFVRLRAIQAYQRASEAVA